MVKVSKLVNVARVPLEDSVHEFMSVELIDLLICETRLVCHVPQAIIDPVQVVGTLLPFFFFGSWVLCPFCQNSHLL